MSDSALALLLPPNRGRSRAPGVNPTSDSAALAESPVGNEPLGGAAVAVKTGDRDVPVGAVGATGGIEDEYPRDLWDLHRRAVRWFEEAERSSMDSREASERDRDYVDSRQWTQAEVDALRARGQPVTTINYCRRKLDLLCGLERKARTDPKAFPRTPTDDDKADAATQVLRYVADNNNFQIIRSAVFNNILVEGFGGCELGLKPDARGGCDVTYTYVGWERIWYDPHSRSPDFLDARYKGLVLWMDRDQAEEMYPGKVDTIGDSFAQNYTSSGLTYGDRPGTIIWVDNQRRRVRVVQCWWLENGTWWGCTYTRTGFLSEPQKSPFKDARGDSACPLVLQSAYINRDNQRYGMIRDLISLQDEINKRHSKALHLLSVRQVVTEQGAVRDEDHARREVAKPDGFIVVNPGMKFEIEQGGDLATGQFQLLQHATQEMQLSGPNAAMSGTDPRELSGRAILAQQAGGAVQNEPLADSLRMWSRRVYEMTWMAVREYWSADRWVRTTDDLNETRWIGINRQLTVRDQLARMPDQQRAQVMQQMQIVPGDPRLAQVVGVENDITDLDVDITIQEGPDIPTMAAENFQTLVQLASMQPGLIPGDVLIAASSLSDKDDLLQRMKAHQQQQAQQQAQQAPLMQAGMQAKVAESQSKAAANFALADERKSNTVRNVHDMHQEFTAPPDTAPGATTHMQEGDPNAMGPDMMLAHQMAELRGKHATAAVNEQKARHTAVQTAHAGAQTAHTLVETNRLAQTPIPQPQAPGAPQGQP